MPRLCLHEVGLRDGLELAGDEVPDAGALGPWLRLSTLATGRTGVRPATAEAYAAVLSAGITPVVHEHGSLGCSGDLAPLSHCALALIGEGRSPEAVVPLDGRHGLGGDTVHVTINAGIGDPIAIGREVERVLDAWGRRSGRRLAYGRAG